MRDYASADMADVAAPADAFRPFEHSTPTLSGIRATLDTLGELSERVEKLLPNGFEDQFTELRARLAGFTAPITFIGQVKAGKTALVNALAGRPGLLPSDVNPWTSVVTTLHVNTPRPRNVRAEFVFFDQSEWEELIQEGGRLGKLAKRAQADGELNEIRAQVEDMYLKSRKRLGRNFELLLGNRHKYDEYTQQLIERYVCLGDQYGSDEASAGQGRFADITRSADIYVGLEGYPVGLSLQDTPGVNDPFLMREQVTLRSVTNASICVVVLSAAQAMNSVDLALIQLLCALESRRVIIFVNRIDELQDPAREVPEIRSALQRVLADHGIGDIGTIVFGSALWAEAVLGGGAVPLPAASGASLARLAQQDEAIDPAAFPALAWQHSGVPDLLEAIGGAVSEGAAAQLTEETWGRLSNLVQTARARNAAANSSVSRLSEEQVTEKIGRLRQTAETYISKDLTAFHQALVERVTQCSEDYVKRMAAELLDRAKANGRAGVETCDPMHLRMRLRTAYIRYASDLRTFCRDIGDGVAQAMADLLEQMLGDAAVDIQLQPPAPPAMAPPIALGRTIVVDLQTTRWKAWMASHISSAGLAREYHSLVEAEVNSIRDELIATAAESFGAVGTLLRAFMDEQADIALAIARGTPLREGQAHPMLQDRSKALDELNHDLRQFRSL
ncbi:hypothetical protein HOY34_12985 [Xinfangfangia sp. D13-10-4-6]|uniref:dynamin family protein n=1 Tax=Pseudogemmobacter hezensis TaxID=2737662 RepID=UPI00155386ED|nr:dynamin family protein [Pseudogemmobacter hezensis]NPD16114.1 hypothetical protein [Pseudogemmobacter hezensis]